MRILPPVLVALALMACGTTEPPEAVVVPPVVVERPAPPEVTTTTVDAEAVALWHATTLWNDTVAWNEAVAANEAAEAARRAAPAPRTSGGGTYTGGPTAGVGMGPCQYNYPSGWGPGTCNGYACGGAYPPCCVMAGESGGNPAAENPTSSASGLWQAIDSTWAGFGGYSHASYAPASVQQDHARMLFAGGAGASHWSATIGCAG